jgi:hypothetical protein
MMDISDMMAIYILISLGGAFAFSVSFWAWMLFDCARRKNLKEKTFWLIVLLLLNIIGSVVYFFNVKNRREK